MLDRWQLSCPTMLDSHPSIVGRFEIAERLGVQVGTVDKWRQRSGDFPAPSWKIGGSPAWEWEPVRAWHAERSAELRASDPSPPGSADQPPPNSKLRTTARVVESSTTQGSECDHPKELHRSLGYATVCECGFRVR